MEIQRIAAFADGGMGGNPAGVVLGASLPDAAGMQAVAAGREPMRRSEVTTVMLVHAPAPTLFHAHDALAAGGVHADPATGAAAAAFAGHRRDLGRPHGGAIEIVQGEEMGMRSRLQAGIAPAPGASVRVAGAARMPCVGKDGA